MTPEPGRQAEAAEGSDPRQDPGLGGGVVVDDAGVARTPWGAGSGPTGELMRAYYDTEWGMPVRDERGLFERLSLEGFQAGLSWATILRKRPAFRAAFADFDPDVVAGFEGPAIDTLLGDAGIIRHRGKIEATIGNARATVDLRDHGGLPDLIWSFQPERTPLPETTADIPTRSAESAALSKALKGLGFRFVGPTTMYALMEAIGMVDTHLLGSHRRGCAGLFAPDGTRIASPKGP